MPGLRVESDRICLGQNDRRSGWDYDADGRLVYNVELEYTYDAAGRVATVQTEGSTTRSCDGDGRQVKSLTPVLARQ